MPLPKDPEAIIGSSFPVRRASDLCICKEEKHSAECRERIIQYRKNEEFTGLCALVPTLTDSEIIHGNLELTRGQLKEFLRSALASVIAYAAEEAMPDSKDSPFRQGAIDDYQEALLSLAEKIEKK